MDAHPAPPPKKRRKKTKAAEELPQIEEDVPPKNSPENSEK